VLDVGCGIGGTAGWLASLDHRVLGIDVSSTAIAEARRRHPDVKGLTFLRADVSRRLRARGPYDVVLDLGCLHQLPGRMRDGYAANIRRLTVSGTRCLYLVRMFERKGRESPDAVASMVQKVLGSEFALELAEPTEMKASHTETSRPGIELRFLRN
jgi:cyclopropane fatty-acyl-phospholipid synthase-like methyltransferase